jgi:hypothetical protein
MNVFFSFFKVFYLCSLQGGKFMFAVVSTQCPDTPCLLEFNKMKEEEPWATLLKNTRLVKVEPTDGAES